jgi:hypothetical protein
MEILLQNIIVLWILMGKQFLTNACNANRCIKMCEALTREYFPKNQTYFANRPSAGQCLLLAFYLRGAAACGSAK